jgi:hypothetical protein
MSEQQIRNSQWAEAPLSEATIVHDDGSTEDVVLVHDKPELSVGEYQAQRKLLYTLREAAGDIGSIAMQLDGIRDGRLIRLLSDVVDAINPAAAALEERTSLTGDLRSDSIGARS